MNNREFLRTALAFVLFGCVATPATAQETEALEEVEVIGVTPTHGVGLPKEKIPANVQSATSEEIAKTRSLDLTDFINRNLGSVTVNEAQNNPLQPDVQYRGFTSSPLLGLPQGLAVYQNGVRVNETFGDVVNWDIIPDSAIASINLMAGSNPLFGLNTLGGALSIRTKNGFTHPGHSVEAEGGSFGRVVTTAESGANNGSLGYYATVGYFDEDGWRDASPSDALNFYGTVGWHTQASTLDLHVSAGDTELRGNGPAPVELLAQSRDAIFTSPDITENDLLMFNLEGSHWFNDKIQLSGNTYHRSVDSDSFNGDSTEFEECNDDPLTAVDESEFLCEGDDPDEPIVDQFGTVIEEDDFNAINNISAREQDAFGAALQTTFLHDLFGRENQFIVGGAWDQGFADFDSSVEAAALQSDRSTDRSGLFVQGSCETGDIAIDTDGDGEPDTCDTDDIDIGGTEVSIETHSRSWGVFFTDTYSVTDALALTVSGRYNNTRIRIGDREGERPSDDDELLGRHTFTRFNPAAGLTWRFHPAVSFFGGYAEGSRAPTAVELACAFLDTDGDGVNDNECRLPNAFLADPPLDQVVSESWEAGFRGQFMGSLGWTVSGFRVENKDDIVFISTGGTTGNIGFFDNVGETQRKGVELGLTGVWRNLSWFLNYSFVHATFETDFLISSPNHPLAVDADADGEIDARQVNDGDRIPGIPQHTLKLGGDYAFDESLSVGADLLVNSDQYFRGDEGNDFDTVDGYAVVNLRGEWKFHKYISAFARVNNLFDSDYETFGIFGEPDEVFPTFTDNRFVSPGAPLSGWVGVKISL